MLVIHITSEIFEVSRRAFKFRNHSMIELYAMAPSIVNPSDYVTIWVHFQANANLDVRTFEIYYSTNIFEAVTIKISKLEVFYFYN